MTSKEDKLLASAVRRYRTLKLATCFNPDDVDSRPTEEQQAILTDTTTISTFVVASNRSGKSAVGGRLTSWWFNNEHPYMERPAEWGKGPLLILVVGRVGKQITEELWANKIKPFLAPGTYHVQMQGGEIQKVTNTKNGNRIIFISHHDARAAREKSQAYTAHFVWVDEMPSSISLISELTTRILANRGRFIATFTPLIRNPEIMHMVENGKAPVSKKYVLQMLQNPMFAGREEEIIEAYAHIPAAERNARLYGEWYVGDLSVYNYDAERSVGIPTGYDPYTWPHVEAVDPAASGKVGYILMAWSADAGRWYVIKAKYLDGEAPSDLVNIIYKESYGYNIVKRIYDPHETWFAKEAYKTDGTRPSLSYTGVYKKTERKTELIAQVQQALRDQSVLLSPHCTDLATELHSCQWSETVENKIVNATKYHLTDALQYAIDGLPTTVLRTPTVLSFDEAMRRDNNTRKAAEAEQTKLKSRGRKSWKIQRSSRRSW